MARIDPQLNIRIPAELKTQIEEAAHENGRSMNAEIVARLNESFDLLTDDPSILIGALISIYEGKNIPISITIGEMENGKMRPVVKKSGV